MKTIFKTKLDICDLQNIELPIDFRILHLDKQDGVPCIWYECDSTSPLVSLQIYCYGTGYNMDDEAHPKKYIGTVQIDGFVWHFYRGDMLKRTFCNKT